MMKKDDRQISIRINGKETKLDESDIERETAAAEDKSDEFEWVLPNQEKVDKKVIDFQKHFEDRQSGQPIMIEDRENNQTLPVKLEKKGRIFKNKKKIKMKVLPKKVVYAILAATIVGLSFGLLMLMLFTQSNIFSESASENHQNESLPAAGAGVGPEQLDLTVYIVQGGAFSSEDKGTEIVNAVREKGFAAVLDTSEDPIRMFIGMASSEQPAILMSDLYKENGQDTYQKQTKITSKAAFTSEQVRVLAAGKQLYEKMLNLTAYEITENQPVESGNWEQIKGQFQKWELQLKGAAFEEKDVEQVEKFKTALQKAVVSFHAYTTNRDKDELWKTEQLLLDTFIAYKNLLQ